MLYVYCLVLMISRRGFGQRSAVWWIPGALRNLEPYVSVRSEVNQVTCLSYCFYFIDIGLSLHRLHFLAVYHSFPRSSISQLLPLLPSLTFRFHLLTSKTTSSTSTVALPATRFIGITGPAYDIELVVDDIRPNPALVWG